MADPHAATDHNVHTHGEMEIAEQVTTYDLFMSMSKWGSVGTAALILWLTLWFGVGSGFVGASFVTAVFLAVSFVALRKKPAAH